MKERRVILYAPSIHTGGGLVLLRAVLASWPTDRPIYAFLDARAREVLPVRADSEIRWVKATLLSRMASEVGLMRECQRDDEVLCFHGLPPLLPMRGSVRVFQQNRNYLGLDPLSLFPWRVRVRLGGERCISRWFRSRVAEYIVQTSAMERTLLAWYGARTNGRPRVTVFPFTEKPSPAEPVVADKRHDFVYVSDGTAHKNHRMLLHAWMHLAQADIRPSLVLTLGPRDDALWSEILKCSQEHRLKISNVGIVSRSEIMQLYAQSRALIFPSISESFGLPLVEAASLGMPILAPELDYVREVCVPRETFDPHSVVSIARAVRRFLDCAEPVREVKDATAFLMDVIKP